MQLCKPGVANRLKNGLAAGLLLLCACTSPRPIVYPNSHAQAVGQAQIEADVAQCRQLAEQAGAGNGHSGNTARAAVRGGAVGGATGAVGGAIAGSAARGAGIGAATGATASVLHELFSGSEPSPAYLNFVERCLHDRGYDLSGWN